MLLTDVIRDVMRAERDDEHPAVCRESLVIYRSLAQNEPTVRALSTDMFLSSAPDQKKPKPRFQLVTPRTGVADVPWRVLMPWRVLSFVDTPEFFVCSWQNDPLACDECEFDGYERHCIADWAYYQQASNHLLCLSCFEPLEPAAAQASYIKVRTSQYCT